MNTRHKKIFASLAITVLALFSQTALALEVNYPNINLLGNQYRITSGSDIAQYAQYLFVFLIALAGILAVISLVIGGIRILAAAGNPGKIGEAKDQIFGSILGVILLMTSFIILRTINADLVSPINRANARDEGTVWYRAFVGDDPAYEGEVYEDGYIYTPAPTAEANTKNIPRPYNELYYYCANPANVKPLLVSVYNQMNFIIDRALNGSSQVDTKLLLCGEGIQIKPNILSFQTDFYRPGVYFYLSEGCKGISTFAYTTNTNIPPFDSRAAEDQRVKSIKVVTGTVPGTIYGAVLTRTADYGGACTKPISPRVPNSFNCYNIKTDPTINLPGVDPFYPESLQIIDYDLNLANREGDSVMLRSKDWVATLHQSGPGIQIGQELFLQNYPTADGVIYATPDTFVYWKDATDANAGNLGERYSPPYPPNINYTEAPKSEEEKYARAKPAKGFWGGFSSGVCNLATAGFASDFCDAPANELGPRQCQDPSSECINSIQHNGTYYTILYGLNRTTKDRVCDVLHGDIANIRIQNRSILQGNRVLEAISIIPTTP